MDHLVDIFNVRVTANKKDDLSVDEQEAYNWLRLSLDKLIMEEVAKYPLFHVRITP